MSDMEIGMNIFKATFRKKETKVEYDTSHESTPEYAAWVQTGIDEFERGEYIILHPEDLKKWFKSERNARKRKE